MNDRDRLFLRHVLEAIAAIESFTVEGRAEFQADLKTQSAVVRQIQIIGEAVKNIDAAVLASEPAVPWRQIAGTRNRLIHAYFKVDLDAVWAMIEQDLPLLKANVQRMLALIGD